MELHIGDYVIDEFGERYCVVCLHDVDGATAAYADIGNSRTSLKVAHCLSLRLDERPHDCDGAPIEVGDVLYRTDLDGKPIGDPLEVEEYIDGTFFAKGHALPMSGIAHTHREPSYGWKKLEKDARKRICDYAQAPRDDDGLVSCDGCRFHKPETGLSCIQNFGIDLVKRAKRLAGIEGEQR